MIDLKEKYKTPDVQMQELIDTTLGDLFRLHDRSVQNIKDFSPGLYFQEKNKFDEFVETFKNNRDSIEKEIVELDRISRKMMKITNYIVFTFVGFLAISIVALIVLEQLGIIP